MRILTITLLLLLCGPAFSQTCSRPGQSPATAFPLCGRSVFSQNSVPLCGGRKIPGPCGGAPDDRNPFFYRFTCYETGTLGFVITPNSSTSDYDWQVFDITNRNPDDIYTDASMFVACNWSGETGPTGASAQGTRPDVCEGFGRPLFSSMPTITRGRTYLLLVSHFTNSQAGYNLVFMGGTASITDSIPPRFTQATAGCSGQRIGVKWSKKIRCSSVAPNGSDFVINTPAGTSITSADGQGCTLGFETDSVTLTLNNALPAGNYWLTLRNGADGNTLLDFCDNAQLLTDSVAFAVLPQAPTPMDRIAPVGCAPTTLDVVMPQGIACSSVAPNGSDFVITGPAAVQVTAAAAINCQNGLSKTLRLTLSTALVQGGTYTVALQSGSDGNTLINECSLPSVAGQTVLVNVVTRVSADVAPIVNKGCQADTLVLRIPNPVPGATYTWVLNGQRIAGPAPIVYTYSPLGNRVVTYGLYATNAPCADSMLDGHVLTSRPVLQARPTTVGASFACPGELLTFADSSSGSPTRWLWNFGNGSTSTLRNPPPQAYPPHTAPGTRNYRALLTVYDDTGCTDTAGVEVYVPNNCYIAVPTGFTPNGDGLNDYLYPLNAWKATELLFQVHNRYGQLVWQTTDWTRKWDGRIGGAIAPTGTYVWTLRYTDSQTGQRYALKGTTVLVR